MGGVHQIMLQGRPTRVQFSSTDMLQINVEHIMRWDEPNHPLYPKLLELRSRKQALPHRVWDTICMGVMGTAIVEGIVAFNSWADWESFPRKGRGGAALYSPENPAPQGPHFGTRKGPCIEHEVVSVQGFAPIMFESDFIYGTAVRFV
jgi:hypothetical protein